MVVMPEGLTRLGSQDYGEYLKHQGAKLAREIECGALARYEPRYRAELAERLQTFGAVKAGMSALCLGARLGAEVRAFIDCGCFAVGLDVNPGEGNRHVVHGDFHQIQFADDSVDVVFTNAVDHVFDLGLFIREVRRVLKPGGLLVMDMVRGSAEGVKPGEYESLFWRKIEHILAPFLAGPFDLIGTADFAWPWQGQHVVLKYRKRGANQDEVVRGAASLPGRCMVPELAFLYQLACAAPPGLPIVELGTFQGRTAAVLCASGAEVVTIDNYVQDPTFTNPHIRHADDPECGKTPEEYAELTRRNLAGLGYSARVVIGDTATVPEGVEQVGLLFIDSQHTAERFNAECDAWLPLMGSGSILACHDYQQPTWPEMTPAIDERITPDQWERLGLVIWLIGFRKK